MATGVANCAALHGSHAVVAMATSPSGRRPCMPLPAPLCRNETTTVVLTALLTLGVADEATPPLPIALWQEHERHRVKLSQQEKGAGTDADYF